jgi:hypothetical protein
MRLARSWFQLSRASGNYEKKSKEAVVDASIECPDLMWLDLLDNEVRYLFYEQLTKLYEKYPEDGRRKRSKGARRRLRAALYDQTVELLEDTLGVEIGVVTALLKVPPKRFYTPLEVQELSDDTSFETVVVRKKSVVDKIKVIAVHGHE